MRSRRSSPFPPQQPRVPERRKPTGPPRHGPPIPRGCVDTRGAQFPGIGAGGTGKPDLLRPKSPVCVPPVPPPRAGWCRRGRPPCRRGRWSWCDRPGSSSRRRQPRPGGRCWGLVPVAAGGPGRGGAAGEGRGGGAAERRGRTGARGDGGALGRGYGRWETGRGVRGWERGTRGRGTQYREYKTQGWGHRTESSGHRTQCWEYRTVLETEHSPGHGAGDTGYKAGGTGHKIGEIDAVPETWDTGWGV